MEGEDKDEEGYRRGEKKSKETLTTHWKFSVRVRLDVQAGVEFERSAKFVLGYRTGSPQDEPHIQDSSAPVGNTSR